MGETSQTRSAPPLTTRGTFEPSTLDRKNRTVEITWSTGARVLRGWWDQFWEELSLDPAHVRLDRLNNGAPFLGDHNGYRAAETPGVIERAWLVKNGNEFVGRALVRFIREGVDPEADKLFEKVADSIVANCSVGYRIHKMVKVEDGEGDIPVMRAIDWTPHEVSAVAIGADDGAGFRNARNTEHNPCEIIIPRGEAPQTKEQCSMADETNKPAPAQVAAPQESNTEAQRSADDAKMKDERERVSTIHTLARKHDISAEQVDKFVREGTGLDAVRTYVLDQLAERSDKNGPSQTAHAVRVTAGEDQRDKFLRGAEAWLIQRAGKSTVVQAAVKAGKVKATETDPGEFRGLTLIGLAREALERSGVNTRRMPDDRIAELALAKRSPGMATASDFPVLLENVTNKVLLGGFEVAPHEWSRFCSRGSVANFHAHNRYRKGAFGTLDDVNDHGELKHKSIPDGEKREVTIGTKGNIIGISRKTLIQDDMGVFTDLAGAFGVAAQNTIEAAVWAVVKANSGLGADFGDGNPLFHTSRANINATGSALSVAGLDADRVKMKRQAAPSGTTVLSLTPAILVLPTELGMLARTLNNDANDPAGNGTKSNGVRGMFRDIVDSAQLTGTRRYLFADPNVAPVIEVTFLQGQEAPQMESQEGFEVLGLQWRIFMDFGVNLVDYRGAVTNAGA